MTIATALRTGAPLALTVMLITAAVVVPALASDSAQKTPATERGERRAYDGAPPVIGHDDFGMICTECHNARGMAVDDLGFAPPSPHAQTRGLSAMSRCTQCHVFQNTHDLFAENSFAGLRQDLRSGGRLHPFAPPTIPHKIFMRENCTACHSGEAAREEIRTSHPERVRCRQCHVAVTTRSQFSTGATP